MITKTENVVIKAITLYYGVHNEDNPYPAGTENEQPLPTV